MKTVEEHLRTLLFEYDYVTIPNFGAFVSNYIPANYNKVSGSLQPPQKKIAFNELLKHDDGLLATHISRKDKVTIEEAKRKIQLYVRLVKDSLINKETFELDSIGKFVLNESNSIIFEPNHKSNFYAESYGLDIVYPTYKRSSTASKYDIDFEQSVTTTNSHKVWTYMLYVIPIFLLIGGLLMLIFTNNFNQSTKTAKSSLNPLDLMKSESKEIKKPDLKLTEKPQNLVSINEKSPVLINGSENKIIEASGRYVIVSGIFKNKSNAKRLERVLLNNGFNAKIVGFDRMLKVIAAENISSQEASILSNKHFELIGEKPAVLEIK